MALLLDTYRPVMVKIETSGGPDEFCRSEGSGFIVGSKDDRTFIVSAGHVIPNHADCTDLMEVIARPSFDTSLEVALTLEQSTANDLALLSASTADLIGARPDAQLANPRPPFCAASFGTGAKPVDPLVFIGYFPGEADPLPYRGNIETLSADGRQRIQGLVNKGISGGPVLNLQGQIIGLVRERVEVDNYGNQVWGKAFITPISVVKADLGTDNLRPAGNSCLARTGPAAGWIAYAANPVKVQKYSFRSTHQVSQTLTSQNQGSGSDLAAYLLDQAMGRNPPPLRYPKQFEQRFAASPGFSFTRIVKSEVLSHNRPSEPIPTTACATPDDCITISPDRKEIVVRFRLYSGPIIDQTRGWLEMIVVADQCRETAAFACT